jgi:hypothetical protein
MTELRDNNLNSSDKRVLSGSNQPNGPALSAIVVILDSYDTLRTTMSYLRKQTIADQIEIVFVVPSVPKIEIDRSELTCFHSWQVVEIDRIISIARAFVAGIRHARAPIVALNEDHSFPDERWAEVLLAAYKGSWAAIAPMLSNGNPDTLLSWADFYQAHHEWCNIASSGMVRHLPWHNSSYKRDILLTYGSELENLMQIESFLHHDLTSKGHRLLLESGTCNNHLNFETWADWLPARYYVGRQYAGIWSRKWSWLKRLFFAAASPLIPLLRLWHVQKNVRKEKTNGFMVRLLPVLFTGLIVEGFGHMIGYIAGHGDSFEKSVKYEFHRVKNQ